jgi:hypothetical protein
MHIQEFMLEFPLKANKRTVLAICVDVS